MNVNGVFCVGLQSGNTGGDAHLIILHGLKGDETACFMSLGRREDGDEGVGHLLLVVLIGRRRIAGSRFGFRIAGHERSGRSFLGDEDAWANRQKKWGEKIIQG